MFVYFLVFALALIYSILADRLSLNNQTLNSSSLVFAIFVLYIALFVGLGDMIGGYDRYIYGEMFDTIANETWGKQNYKSLLYLVEGREYGYFAWEILCSFITQNRYIFLLLTTFLIYALFFVSIKKYIDNYPLAVIFFLGLFFYFTMTYLRQVIACGILWCGMNYLWERKLVKFLLLVLLAYSFHNSALLFVMVYFIPLRRHNKWVVVGVMFLCLLIGLTPIPTLLLASSGGDRTVGYEDQMTGFRIEYIWEAVFLISLYLSFYKNLTKDVRDIAFVNTGLIFCAILLIFMKFGQGGRLGWFFLIGVIYMLTNVSSKGKFHTLLKPILFLLSFVLFSRITILWSGQIAPYKTFLENGEPAGSGYIYERYEYDHNYDVDKFYRPAFWFQDFKKNDFYYNSDIQ